MIICLRFALKYLSETKGRSRKVENKWHKIGRWLKLGHEDIQIFYNKKLKNWSVQDNKVQINTNAVAHATTFPYKVFFPILLGTFPQLFHSFQTSNTLYPCPPFSAENLVSYIFFTVRYQVPPTIFQPTKTIYLAVSIPVLFSFLPLQQKNISINI